MKLLTQAYAELRTERETVVYAKATSEGRLAGSFSLPGPIPWSAMLEWCRWHMLDRATTNYAIAVIGLVDQRIRKIAIDRAKMK